MVYSESLAVRIRKDVGERPDVTERKMFADLGEVALRGFEDPVRLYEVRGPDA